MELESWLDYKFKNLDKKIASLNKDTVDITVSSKKTSSKNNIVIPISPSELVIQLALDGIVYDEEMAKTEGCKCVPLPTGKSLCWAKGVIGALSQAQVKKYCTPEKTTIEEAKIPAHVEKFIEASKACEKGKTYDSTKIETLEDRLICMHKMLSEV